MTAKIKLVKVGKSDMGRSFGLFADDIPIAMVNTFSDGTTHVVIDLGTDTIEFLKYFAPKVVQ